MTDKQNLVGVLNPKQQLRGKLNNSVVYVGNPQSDKYYVHKQISASDTWIIVHNLSKYPSVTIVDSAGNVVLGELTYNNANQLTIKFTAAFSGKAYLN